MRLRDLGLRIGRGTPGPKNAITDVPGVRVGTTTLIRGSGPLVVGTGPVRTGVTVVVPAEHVGRDPVFAGAHRLSGNGELTGLEWIRESGLLTTPVAITNTHSVGIVRDALVAADVARRDAHTSYWSLPVVGETYDGLLNDINGFHVRAEHVRSALEAASDGPVAEGNVGGGTGMICHGFKGGTGTSSRLVATGAERFAVGILVQANHGRRERLAVNGVPVGERIGSDEVPDAYEDPDPIAKISNEVSDASPPPGAGSIIAIVATDAPLLPHQCERLAQRAGFGVARTGGVGELSSGDLFLAFATGNTGRLSSYKVASQPERIGIEMLSDLSIDPLYDAVIEATEEAIVNALLGAETMEGRDGHVAYALEAGRLLDVMTAFGRGPDGGSKGRRG
jgi:D-aminopeptidase